MYRAEAVDATLPSTAAIAPKKKNKNPLARVDSFYQGYIAPEYVAEAGASLDDTGAIADPRLDDLQELIGICSRQLVALLHRVDEMDASGASSGSAPRKRTSSSRMSSFYQGFIDPEY